MEGHSAGRLCIEKACPTLSEGYRFLAGKEAEGVLGLLAVEVGVASSRGGKTSSLPRGAPSAPFPFLVSA